jgi:hypothetical protein
MMAEESTKASLHSVRRHRTVNDTETLSFKGAAATKRTCLQLPPQISLERWRQIGDHIGEIHNSSAWWLADWLVYGQQKYPDRYRSAIAETSLDYQTLRNYVWVARKFPVSRRRDRLSFQHHAEVSSLPVPDQDRWLDLAEASGWSVKELRRQSRAARDERQLQFMVIMKLNVPVEKKRHWQAAAHAEHQDLPEWIVNVMDDAAEKVLAFESTSGRALGSCGDKGLLI